MLLEYLRVASDFDSYTENICQKITNDIDSDIYVFSGDKRNIFLDEIISNTTKRREEIHSIKEITQHSKNQYTVPIADFITKHISEKK